MLQRVGRAPAANGFRVRPHNVPDPGVYRARFGIPRALGSCHTAVVEG
jgi:hypothetical protein